MGLVVQSFFDAILVLYISSRLLATVCPGIPKLCRTRHSEAVTNKCLTVHAVDLLVYLLVTSRSLCWVPLLSGKNLICNYLWMGVCYVAGGILEALVVIFLNSFFFFSWVTIKSGEIHECGWSDL